MERTATVMAREDEEEIRSSYKEQTIGDNTGRTSDARFKRPRSKVDDGSFSK